MTNSAIILGYEYDQYIQCGCHLGRIFNRHPRFPPAKNIVIPRLTLKGIFELGWRITLDPTYSTNPGIAVWVCPMCIKKANIRTSFFKIDVF